MIADFIGCLSVSIEGLAQQADGTSYNVASGGDDHFMAQWKDARSTSDAQKFLELIAAEAPCVLRDPAGDVRVPNAERELLKLAGINAAAIAPIRFDGQLLGIVGAVSQAVDFFDEAKIAVLTTIADHLAPAIKVALLRDELEASYLELEKSSRDSLARLADAAEARDTHTGGHLRRIRTYSVELARELGLPEHEAQAIGSASTVHDLGKLNLPDSVLMNPGKLKEDDWELIRLHPEHGARLIGDSPMFEIERTVARWHHERWDGSGYPDGLRGDAIPLPARIVAVADAFDALTTERPYKRAWSLTEAYDEIVRVRRTLFCPLVVDALAALRRDGRLASILESAGDEHSTTHARAIRLAA
jgi:HD-GYP domain-containing protein (c-di-GMP phosphodiesterase class II)